MIIFNNEEIWMGFDNQSGLAIGTALDGFELTSDPGRSRAESRVFNQASGFYD
jgi:hypothetical protein